MKKKIWSCGLAMALLAAALVVPVQAKEVIFPAGIHVQDIDLTGMTGEAATAKVQDYVDSISDQKIRLEIGDKTVDTTAGDLGFFWENSDVVQKAADEVLSGNLIKRYMVSKDLEKEPMNLDLTVAFDNQKVQEFIDEESADVFASPSNASITRVDGKFEITPSVSGMVVDAAATQKALNEALTGDLEKEITVQAVVKEEEPRIRTEDLETIQDVLGTFSTDFSSSGSSRSGNLANGASKINGHILMPGETLSGYECMQPFTKENGYFTAAAYENGQVVDSIGGGVCQIATTLYNASLLAEVEITQRQNHSMIVGYVKPSMDAAIAGTYKDIKITNNYSTPIYVEAGTSGKTLTFTIYGKDTRPENREIKFVSETLSVTNPGGATVKYDSSMAPGARKQVQSAHKGLKSQLWKEVYVDGEQTERTLLSKDTYNASKAIVLEGPRRTTATVPSQQAVPSLEPVPAPAETAAPAPVETPSPAEGPGAFIN